MATRREHQPMPPLADEAYAALAADVARNGVMVPLEFGPHGLLDGHHRRAALAKARADGRVLPDAPAIVRPDTKGGPMHSRYSILARTDAEQVEAVKLVRLLDGIEPDGNAAPILTVAEARALVEGLGR